MIYCKWCGNNSVNDDEQPCEVCKALLTNHLEPALDAFKLIADHYGICCRGLVTRYSRLERAASVDCEINLAADVTADLANAKISECVDASHLYIHPKGGEDSNNTVTVECGVNLYPGYARCYWIFDSDRSGFSEGREYGPEISYCLGAEQFMKILDAVLNQAANAASTCGVVSCPHCGDHHHEDYPCDCQPNIYGPRGDAAKTLRELVEYADAADPQLIDALQELACLCEADAPISLIQDKLRVLASEVQGQDPMMADDLRHTMDSLDEKND